MDGQDSRAQREQREGADTTAAGVEKDRAGGEGGLESRGEGGYCSVVYLAVVAGQ